MKVLILVLVYTLSTATTVDGLLEGHHIPSTQELINMLNQLNNTFQQSNQKLQAEYAALAKNTSVKISTLETELATLKKNSSEKISTLETELATLKSRTLHSPVAFFVTLSKSVGPLSQYQAVPYDRVVTNLQNGYDTRQCHFVVPLKGIYQFSVTLMVALNGYNNVELVRNGERVLVIHSESTNAYESGSTSAVLSLDVGDRVWVRRAGGTPQTLYGSNFNHFSGVLIQSL